MEAPGPYEAFVLADSEAQGVRLTTLWCTFAYAQLLDAHTQPLFPSREFSRCGVSYLRGGAGYALTSQVVSATEWDDFFARRLRDPLPGVRNLAKAMKAARDASEPEALAPGMWHLPFVFQTGSRLPWPASRLPFYDDATLLRLSVARCARGRVNYEDPEDDLAHYNELRQAGNLAAFEHAAMFGYPMRESTGRFSTTQPGTMGWASRGARFGGPFIANLRAPWIQHRLMLSGEK